MSNVMDAFGSLAQGRAASNAAKYNADLDLIQAKTASDQAAIAAGEEARKTRQRLAAQRAGAAQEGVETTGSVLDVMDATASQGQLDYLTSVYNGDVNNVSRQNDAKLNRMKATAALTQGWIGATSAIFKGASKAATFGGPGGLG